MAVYRKKQPARRPVRRGWKRHARTGMFLFAFALVAVTVGVILPHAGVMSAAAEGSTLTEKIFTTVQNKNLPVIAIDPGHGGTDPGSEGSGLWEYEMTWQVANELVNLLEQDGRYAPVLTITEEESQNSDMPRVEPAERAQRANDAGAVLLFSIHGNSDPSGTASGFECYAIPPGQQYHDESVALARLTAQKITQTGQPLRGQDGVRYIYFDTYDNRMVYESSDETPHNEPTFRLLADADCPAVLVEQCFLTNPQDAARLATPLHTKTRTTGDIAMAPLHHRFWPKGVPHDVRVPRVTLVDYLEVAARRYPDKPAIVYGGATTDYRSLRARVDALAAYLQQRLGVRQGDRILLMSQNCPQFITAFYAALRAGAAIVPVSPMSTAEVTLVFDNSDGRLGEGKAEVADIVGAVHGLAQRAQPVRRGLLPRSPRTHGFCR